MHQTGHAVWHFPLGDRIRIKKHTIDIGALCVYVFLADGGLMITQSHIPFGFTTVLFSTATSAVARRISVRVQGL